MATKQELPQERKQVRYQLLKPWLGREDSNLRMAESKSSWFPLSVNARSEKSGKFHINPLKRLADISECRNALRVISVMRPLPSEGRGHKFESCRARQRINSLEK